MVITYGFVDKQLRLVIDARSHDLPVDGGDGAATGAAYPCANTSTSLLGGAVVDTAAGSCLELTAPADADAVELAATLTTANTGPLDTVDVYLDTLTATSGFVPRSHTQLIKPPASPTHRYRIVARKATASQRQLKLEVALNDPGVANTGEAIVLEEFNPADAGKLTTRVRFSQVPAVFHTVLAATLGDGADLDTAPIIDARIDSAAVQANSPEETLLVEQHDGQQLLSLLSVASFAPTYHYQLTPMFDAADRRVGAQLKATFPDGAPADGRLVAAMYRDGSLDTALDFFRFSPATTFDAKVTGDPDRPDDVTIDLANQAAVSGQLVQVLQYPANGAARRVVLAEAAADPARITPPVTGQNVYFVAIPSNFKLKLAASYAPDSSPQVPKQVVISGTSSEVSPTSRLELTDDTTPDGTFGLVLKAPTTNHRLQVDFDGTLADIRAVRIARDNNGPRPEQATQIYLRDGAGLRGQLLFSGPAANPEGLLAGPAREFEATATNVADNYALGIDITTTDGRPTEATLAGANSSAAPAMDLRLVDHRNGFSFRAASLTQDWTYRLGASFNGAGQPTAATVAASAQSLDNPEGLIELTYGRARLVARGLSRTFTYRIKVLEGDISDPARASVQVEQSAPNPAQLLQFASYAATPRDSAQPVFVFSVRNAGSPVLREDGATADVVWTKAPQNFEMDLGRHFNPGGGSAELGATLSPDAPGSALTVRQTRPGGRQELRLVGLAPVWRFKLDFAGAVADPESVKVDLSSSIRHADDAVELLNYPAGATTPAQRLLLRGPAGTPPTNTTGSKIDADYQGASEAVVLQYGRHVDAQSGKETGFDVELENKDAFGSPRPNPAGKIVASLMANEGKLSEKLTLTDIPATISQLSYTFPADSAGLTENCLGHIGYSASGSSLDIIINQHDAVGCLAGVLTATIQDLPSEGFAEAALRPDGSGRFLTKEAPGGGGLQEVTRINLDAPLPKPVDDFMNKPISLDKELCPAVFKGLGCSHVKIDVDPNFVGTRLVLDADRLTDLRIETNVGLGGNPKPEPGGVAHTNEIGHELWKYLPLFVVENKGAEKVTVNLVGGKDLGQPGQETRKLVQDVACCKRFPLNKSVRFHSELPLDGKDLAVRFYGWQARNNAGCDGSPGSGVVKCNEAGDELRYTYGSMVHRFPAVCCAEEVPFRPRFDVYEANKEKNGFTTPAGTTRYYVPNLFDRLLTGDDGKRWSAKNDVLFLQSDWLFASLLHEYRPDPLHAFG